MTVGAKKLNGVGTMEGLCERGRGGDSQIVIQHLCSSDFFRIEKTLLKPEHFHFVRAKADALIT